MSTQRRLGADFFGRPALQVAPELLGVVLRSQSAEGIVAVRLTEVEAYEGEADPGSHAHRGRTARNAVMFGPPGRLYVYFSYGVHWCANLVCGTEGTASAVLLRAGEVVEGVDLARARRPATRSPRDLARGPARLAAALGLTGADDGLDITRPGARLAAFAAQPSGTVIRRGPRVGLSRAAERPWRFWYDGDPTVSAYRPAVLRRRSRSASGRLDLDREPASQEP